MDQYTGFDPVSDTFDGVHPDASGEEKMAQKWFNAISLLTAPPDTQAPTVPGGLASSNITQSSFTLSWTPSTDVVGVTGYEVFRNGVSVGTPSSATIHSTRACQRQPAIR